MSETLEQMLERHEGRRRYPYVDTVGKTSIGVGRNLTDRGLRDDEIDLMLKNDIAETIRWLMGFPAIRGLSGPRLFALCSMAFNLGETRFRTFVKMLAALERGDYGAAADEMLKSRWASQVGDRAVELAEMMREG